MGVGGWNSHEILYSFTIALIKTKEKILLDLLRLLVFDVKLDLNVPIELEEMLSSFDVDSSVLFSASLKVLLWKLDKVSQPNNEWTIELSQILL